MTLSFLIAPVVASTFSTPKNFWRALIMAAGSAWAHADDDAPRDNASGSTAAMTFCRLMSPPFAGCFLARASYSPAGGCATSLGLGALGNKQGAPLRRQRTRLRSM